MKKIYLKINILILALVFFNSCNSNIYDPFTRDGKATPLISTAKSLTEEGDAHLANGDLEAALTSYESALDKDEHFEPAIIGKVSVTLQILVREEFPSKQTFTSAAVSLIYGPINALIEKSDSSSSAAAGSSASSSALGSLTLGNIQDSPEIATIRSNTRVLATVNWAYNELNEKIRTVSSSLIINMTVLLAYDLLYQLVDILNSVESLQTLANQLVAQSENTTKFDADVASLVSITIDPLNYQAGAQINTDPLIQSVNTSRNVYQRLYYVYYFFKNDFSVIESKLTNLNAKLQGYLAKVSASNNKLIKDLLPQIQSAQSSINNVTSQFAKANEIKTGFENTVLSQIKKIESDLNNLQPEIKNATRLVSFDISMCGLTLQDSQGSRISGEIAMTQADTGSAEYNKPPIISDDPENPCTGNNPRFTQTNQ